MDREAERLRVLAGVLRARNGRLAIDWLSRRQKPRWKMVALNGQWYDRDRLQRELKTRPPPAAVPASRRRLTQAELGALSDPNPWRLYDRRREGANVVDPLAPPVPGVYDR